MGRVKSLFKDITMMQHVATAKSEVAAFAIGAETSDRHGSTANEQFGKLLQDQQNSSPIIDKSAKPPTKEHQPSPRLIDEKHTTSKAAEGIETEEKYSRAEGEPVPQQKIAGEVEPSSDQTKLSKVDGVVNNDKNVSETSQDVLDVKPAISEITSPFIAPEINLTDENSAGITPSSKTENVDVQEWVSLVDNLQKLIEDTPKVESELESMKAMSLFDDALPSEAEIKIPHKMHSTVKEESVVRTAENLPITESEHIEIDEVSSSLAEQMLQQAEQASNKEELSQMVTQILNVSPEAAKTNALVEEQKPTTLVENQLNTLDVVDASVGDLTSEQKLPDLTISENKALLSALLEIESSDKSTQLSTEEKETQSLTSLTKALDLSESFEQSEPAAIALDIDETSIEQDIVMEQLPPVMAEKLTKEDKSVDVKTILGLSDTKLEKVLVNITDRIIDTKKVNELAPNEQNTLVNQRTANILTADLTSPIDTASKEFVAALKAGLQEFKSQLAQGREPGIDLKGLISEAASHVSDKGVLDKEGLGSGTVVKAVSQILDFSSILNQSVEHNQSQTYNASLRDVAQIQGEQGKQIQLNQFEAKFEKAINITKPEGHQQLAEKVRWMVNTKNLVADIRLDPAELGSVQIKVAMSGESANVNFVVQSHHARDAVDSATPRLREMLAEKGIELGQSSVRQETGNQQQQAEEQFAGDTPQSEQAEEVDIPEQIVSQQKVVNGALGGIDYFV